MALLSPTDMLSLAAIILLAGLGIAAYAPKGGGFHDEPLGWLVFVLLATFACAPGLVSWAALAAGLLVGVIAAVRYARQYSRH